MSVLPSVILFLGYRREGPQMLRLVPDSYLLSYHFRNLGLWDFAVRTRELIFAITKKQELSLEKYYSTVDDECSRGLEFNFTSLGFYLTVIRFQVIPVRFQRLLR